MSKLVAVQVLRAVAALSIALLHGQHEAALMAGRRLATGDRLFPWEAGVDVFFVISGFVMVYASGPLFGRTGAARDFLGRRVARVVPLYWITTSLFLAVLALRPGLVSGGASTPQTILASYLFIPIARPDGIVQPVYTLGWTLNYEMFFYGLFALALGWPRRGAVAVASAAILALVAFGLAAAPGPAPLRFWTDPILLEFAVGMALGLARAEGVTIAIVPRMLLALLGVVLFGAAGGDVVALTGRSQVVVFALPAACLVASCGFAPARREERVGWLPRLGSALGDASYAIYLVHPFVIRGLRQVVEALGAGHAFPGPAFVVMGLVGASAAAFLLHLGVERPATRLLRAWLDAGPRIANRPQGPDEHKRATPSETPGPTVR